jgi:uncharacterized protein
MTSHYTWIAALSLLFLPLGASCAEHEVGGKTAENVFSDREIAALASAACEGRTDEVRRLVREGANVNAIGYEGSTPLLWALSCESRVGMEALLSEGANPNLTTEHGFSAVIAASTYRNPELLDTLLRHGGDPDAHQTNGYRTALNQAFGLGVDTDDWRNYYRLLDAGADINSPDRNGMGIAMFAVSMGRFAKAVELMERGYNHDLQMLANAAAGRDIPRDSPEMPHKHRLIELLRQRGFARNVF